MTCCLTALSHYLNQYWLTVNEVECHIRAISQEMPQPSITKIWNLIFHSNFPGANELINVSKKGPIWPMLPLVSLFDLNTVGYYICTHYSDVIMGTMASQITSLATVYSTIYSGADQRKHQCSASLAFVRGIHRSPVNYPHKGPVTRRMIPFNDVIMGFRWLAEMCYVARIPGSRFNIR